MSKRLQVVLRDDEMAELRRAAADRGVTVSEWVRQTMRRASRESSDADIGLRLAIIRAAAGHAFPTADIEQILAEIEVGYTSP